MSQNSPSNDLSVVLNEEGVTTDIYVNFMPNTPNNCLVLYDTSYNPSNPKYLLDEPGVQIRSRGTTQTTAYNNLLEAFNVLVGKSSFIKNTTRYTGILSQTNMFSLGLDETNRYMWAVNLRLYVEPAANGKNRTAL